MNNKIFNNNVLPVVLACLAGLPLSVAAHEDEGEAHGLPPRLGGIDLSGGTTWYFQGASGANGDDAVYLTYTLDLAFQGRVSESGKVVVALEAGNGGGIDDDLGSLSTANYDAFITELGTPSNAFNVPSLSQVYYQGAYWGGALVVDFGKLDIHSLYDDNRYANDETDQFLSAIFTRSAGTTYPELDQYYAPGLALTLRPVEMLELRLIGANGRDSGFDRITNQPYTVAQVNLRPRPAGRRGNYRFYGIYDWRVYQDIAGGSRRNWAWGLSFDQAVTETVGLFLRYSVQDDQVVENYAQSAWSAGAAVAGGAWGRAADSLGAGFGAIMTNDDPAARAAAGVSQSADETHLEIYYRIGFSDHFTLTPDLQVIGNGGGRAASETALVAGLRAQLNF